MVFTNLDIVKDLRKQKVLPTNSQYLSHVKRWLVKNIYQGKVTTDQSKAVDVFSRLFCENCGKKWTGEYTQFKRDHYDFLSQKIDFLKLENIKMSNLYLGSERLPYLSAEVIEEFAEIVIKSDSGYEFRINHLLWMGWSNLSKRLLHDALIYNLDVVTITTDFSSNEIHMLYNFIMKNILPCSEMEIVNDKLAPEINNVFLTFGINLKFAVSNMNSRPIKTESDFDFPDMSDDIEMGLNQEVCVKMEVLEDDDQPNYFEEFHEVMNYIDEKPVAKKRKNRVKKDLDQPNDYEEEFNEEMNYVSDEPPKKRGKYKVKKYPCEKCSEVFHTRDKLREHNKHVHKLDGVRGLYEKVTKLEIGHYKFIKHDIMLQHIKDYKNSFVIQIAPHEFSKDDFEKFVFPKPVEEYLAFPEKLLDLWDLKNKSKCKHKMCKQKFSSEDALKDHYIHTHNLEYVCPYEKCSDKVRNKSLFEFARHIYYHENKHPQLEYPHECIACGFKTPYMKDVQNHIKIEGPYHDNSCPKCPEKFNSRFDLLQHVKLRKHDGFPCGMCTEVFETTDSKNLHRRTCRPEGFAFICDDCGKVYKSQHSLNAHRQVAHCPLEKWPCGQCDKILDNKGALYAHKKNVHNKKPCTTCGKLFNNQHMKEHILANHTEDHLKPFICKVCNKGFSNKLHLKYHMNLHTGEKPYKCKYCGRAFADTGNCRMHERTVHEGYKRSDKRETEDFHRNIM